MQTEQVIIIGAGPAGIATAIQLKRQGVEFLLLEKERLGGLLVNANLVENYPGFPRGISGIDLVDVFKSHLEVAGITVSFEEVLQLDYNDVFIVQTSKRELKSEVVVVASGTKPREFTGPSIEGITPRFLYEVYPIANVEGKRIVIIGAGDAAFDYALNLGRRNEVTILNRGKKRKCLPVLWERAQKMHSVNYQENSPISSVQGFSDRVLITYKGLHGECEIEADYVIFAIGRVPQMDFLSERIQKRAPELTDKGLLYFVGDVKNGLYRQCSIAIGDGIRAAMEIKNKFQGGG